MDEEHAKNPAVFMLKSKNPKDLTPEERTRLETLEIQHKLQKTQLQREVEAELAPIRAKLGMGDAAATKGWGDLRTK